MVFDVTDLYSCDLSVRIILQRQPIIWRGPSSNIPLVENNAEKTGKNLYGTVLFPASLHQNSNMSDALQNANACEIYTYFSL